MIAVASGTAARVYNWSRLLAHAAVPCSVARPCGSRDYAELWVDLDDVDRARAVLCSQTGGKLIW
jgi:hypothetical protein